MVRLINTKTKVIVNVDEELVSKLGSDWEPVTAKRKPGRPPKAETK